MKNTLSKKARLCYSKDFQHAFKHGDVFADRHCKIYAAFNENEPARLGVIVAKRIVRLATHRHQWKRIARESFRLNAIRLHGRDVIVMIKKPPQSKAQLRTVLDILLQRIEQKQGIA